MLLNDIRDVLRAGPDHDKEIQDLINAAKAEMKSKGIAQSKIIETDPLIARAINCYCKANYGYDNPEADRFQQSYDSLVTHMSLSSDYVEVTT